MVTVPEYQANVATRPIFQSKLDANATPESFGKGIGEGMVSLATGLESLGTSISKVQNDKEAAAKAERERQEAAAKGTGTVETAVSDVATLDNAMRAKESENQLAAWDRNARYGKDGFMTLKGQAAVDGRADYERQLLEKQKELGAGLPAGADEMYNRASYARVNASLQSAVVHSSQQRKAWFRENTAARVDSFAKDALVNFNRPDLVTKNVAAGLLELQEQGRLENWSGGTMMERGSEFISGVYRDITLRIAEDDPIAADDYRKAHAGQMTGADHDLLTQALEDEISNEHSKREAGSILTQGRRASQPSHAGGDLPGDLVDAGTPSGRTVASGWPTRLRQSLSARVPGKDTTAIDNLDESFATNLAAMIDDAPPAIRKGLQIIGSSNGAANAVDLGWNGRALKSGGAPKEVLDYIHDNAARYGMYFPISDDPEQDAPFSTRGGTVAPRGNRVAPRTLGPSADNIEESLAGIADPRVRELTHRRVQAALETQSRAEEAREKQAKAELWRAIDEGKAPDDVPREIRQAAGMEAVSAAWSYRETAAKGRAVQSDEVLLYDMRKSAATDPDGFANVDLNDYRGRLSAEAIGELADMQTVASTKKAEMRREGQQLADAFAQSEAQLESIGISARGRKGPEREAAIRQIARFQNALASEMAAFKRENNGKAPSELDITSMRNKLLLPMVLREPEPVTENPVLEVSDWADLLSDARQALALELSRELGREPNEAEVMGYYKGIVSLLAMAAGG